MPLNCKNTLKDLGLGAFIKLRNIMKQCISDENERCGVILNNGTWIELENNALDKKTTWLIEADDIMKYYHEIKAVWHTHPGKEGKPTPSKFDIESVDVNKNLYHIIISSEEFYISRPTQSLNKTPVLSNPETEYHSEVQTEKLPKLRTVKFKGFFKSIFGDYLRVRFDNIKDLCEILSLPLEWRPRLKSYWPAMFPGTPWIKKDLEDRLIITMMPPLFGADNGAGMFNAIVGALLIVVGVLVGVFFGWTGVGAQVAVSLIMSGVTTMAAGIYQLLTPTPIQEQQAVQTDGYTGYPKSTTKEGTIIPVVYGNVITSGHILSFISTTATLSVATSKYAYKPL